MLPRPIRKLPLILAAVGVLSALSASSAIAQPTPTTLNATEVDTTSATLNGIISPEGEKAKYLFAYGTEKESEDLTPTRGRSSNSSTPIEVNEPISGLEPGTTYYFLIVMIDPGTGEFKGGERLSFTTLATTHPAQFLAAQYPVTVSGSNLQSAQFIAANGAFQVVCGTRNLSASLTAATSELLVTPQLSSCSSGGSQTTVKMNSCKYLFKHAPTFPFARLDVACETEGDSIEYVTGFICTVKVPAQAGAKGEFFGYSNSGPATARYVKVLGTVQGLKWTSTNQIGCKGAGIPASGEDGRFPFHGTQLKANNSGGTQVEFYVLPANN